MNKAKIFGIFLMFLTAVIFVYSKDFIKAELKTTAQCEMCKERIEKHLKDIEGINYIDLDIETAICSVSYDSTKISLDKIRKEISLVGYDADDVKADKIAYKKLPKCCKVPGKK